MSTQLVLVTHGSLAESLAGCAELIVGSREGLVTLSNENYGLPGLAEAVGRALDALPADAQVLLMTDFAGGSCHTASRLALKRLTEERRRGVLGLFAGVNLPMLLAFLNKREHLAGGELLDAIMERATAGIRLEVPEA